MRLSQQGFTSLIILSLLASTLDALGSGEFFDDPVKLRVTLSDSVAKSQDVISALREIKGTRASVEHVHPKSSFLDVRIPEGSRLDEMIAKYSAIRGIKKVARIPSGKYRNGVVMISFAKTLRVEEARKVIHSLSGARVANHLKFLNLYVIQLPKGTSAKDAIKHYAYKHGVNQVSLDGIVSVRQDRPTE